MRIFVVDNPYFLELMLKRWINLLLDAVLHPKDPLGSTVALLAGVLCLQTLCLIVLTIRLLLRQ